jgi:uncharacterized protein YoxC
MEHPKQTPLIERLYEIRANLRSTLREASSVSAKLAGDIEGSEGAAPERVQDSVNSLTDDISYAVLTLQKIVADQHGVIGSFAPPQQPAGRVIRA